MTNTKKNLITWAGGVILIGILIWGLFGWNGFEKAGLFRNKQSSEKNRNQTVGTNIKKEVPELVVKEGTYFDIGTVKEGARPQVSFTLKNIGDAEATIAIDDLSKCGCTAVSFVPKIPAGDSSKLEFIFETLGYGGQSITRRIRVNYNNPALSPFEIIVAARIIEPEPYQALVDKLWYGFYVLIDIRSPEAYAKEHIVGSVNVPLQLLEDFTANIPNYILIYLISENGEKSDLAAKMLRENGLSECVSLAGGLNEWKLRYGIMELLISGNR